MTGIAPPHPEKLRDSLIEQMNEALQSSDAGPLVVNTLADWLREADWGPVGGGHTMVPHYLADLLDGGL